MGLQRLIVSGKRKDPCGLPKTVITKDRMMRTEMASRCHSAVLIKEDSPPVFTVETNHDQSLTIEENNNISKLGQSVSMSHIQI